MFCRGMIVYMYIFKVKLCAFFSIVFGWAIYVPSSCFCLLSLFFTPFFTFILTHTTHFFYLPYCMCVQFVIQTIGREMISLNRVNKSCECGTMNIRIHTHRMKEYRRERNCYANHVWHGTTAAATFELKYVWMDGECECECECVQPTKITTCSIA